MLKFRDYCLEIHGSRNVSLGDFGHFRLIPVIFGCTNGFISVKHFLVRFGIYTILVIVTVINISDHVIIWYPFNGSVNPFFLTKL